MNTLYIVKLLSTAGFAAIFILAALVFAVGFIIERSVRLYGSLYVKGKPFMAEIQTYILNNDLDGAIRVCNAKQDAALPKVLKAGLMRASRSEEQIQNAIDAASLEVIPQVERNLPFLATIANLSTLFGLLGTILGLIGSFSAISNLVDPAQRQQALSAGISEAMYATAFGLVVAIMAMVAHAVLSSRASAIVSDIDEYSVKLLDLISARKVQHSSEK